MANPSHSTIAPDPLNPDQAVDRRKLLIGGMVLGVLGACRSYFDRLSTNGTSNSVRPELGRRVNGGVARDPALLAYARVLEADEATLAVEADEEDPVYRGLCDAYDRAEAAFAATRATSPDGVRAKLDRIAYRCQWEPERAFHDCPLVPSIIADFRHLMREMG